MRRISSLALLIAAVSSAAFAEDNPFIKRTDQPKVASNLVAKPIDLPVQTTESQGASEGAVPTQTNAMESSQSPSDLPVREVPSTPQQSTSVPGPTLSSALGALLQSSDAPVVEERDGDSEDEASDDSELDLDEEMDDIDFGRNNFITGPSIYGTDRLAKIVGDRIAIPKLITPTIDISKIGSNQQPEDLGGDALVDIKALPEGYDRNEDWTVSNYLWQAPNTFSHPLYFDDPMLERHGHERYPCLTPVISGARFFATIPMLPYLGAIREPVDCVYTLGHYRPGTCAPALLKRPPYDRRAIIIQSMSTAGAMVAFP